MANEIRQKLSFDASAAIQSINALSETLLKFGTTLGNVGGGLAGFNAKAAGSKAALSSLATGANSAASKFASSTARMASAANRDVAVSTAAIGRLSKIGRAHV